MRTDYKNVCGAKTRGGTPCKSRPMPNGRCRMHGGGSPFGVGSPRFSHGRYSKYVPARLLASYHEALEDAELLEMRNEIALLDTRLAELLTRLEEAGVSGLWRELQEEAEVLRKAQSLDIDGVTHLLERVEAMFEVWNAESRTWAEVQSLVQQRRRVVESERKRLIDMQQMVTKERAMALMTAVVHAVTRHVKDPHILRAVSSDLRALMTKGVE